MKKIVLFVIFASIFLISTSFAVDINSEKAVLMDISNGRIIYQKDAYAKAYPASTTKIMTAILALENLDLNMTLIASENAVNSVPEGGSIVGIRAGEEFTVEYLLEGLLIASGNEAANILAEGISGTIEEFVNRMNEKCLELDLTLTHFVNSNGLHNENHYSCAYDLALLYRYAYNQFPDFRRICSMKSLSLPATSIYDKDDRIFTNSNKLINSDSKYFYEYCTGGKTGYTSEAKNCLVSSASKDGVELIACILGGGTTEEGDSQRYLDTISIFDYGFSNLSLRNIVKSGDVVDSISIENQKNKDDLLKVIVNKPVTATVDIADINTIFEPKIELIDELVAPINSRRLSWKSKL